MNNSKDKRMFIKNSNDNIYFLKNDGKKYLTVIQMRCDNECRASINILSISCNEALIYKHIDISDANKAT